MFRKTGFFLLLIFIILIIIPLIIIKGIYWRPSDTELLLKVYDHQQKKIVTMELEDYLRGVVAAEMPALYDIEALKAQAVAARTYTLRQLPVFGGKGCKEYPGADISTDYRYSQAWLSEKEMKKRWGFLRFFYYWAKINRSIEETEGEVLFFQGRPIDAVYHANSGGMTEAAEYVWGKETSYLKSVESPYDIEKEKNYCNKYYIGSKDLINKLHLNGEIMGIPLVEIIEYSESQRVLNLKIAEQTFSGTEFREKFDLPSTKFSLTVSGEIITVTVFGKGHGVGMSQDGAEGFALKGYTYKEILNHYYPGTILTKYK